ncbi:hypothetical protein SARC_09724 [Sphaeroforma arctica JP610]|uniref:Uncharacterized protein n=1 Tax=Sphaeroforma arctica JP610 TaxID=667725 RepID=A0A0L0FM19_9EUKA|nr:hypothetical protein SARC_09724 [Sphaeroforma arctica JP610]KNC77829.1 hypothetical protein SARC_09724 [Sphaeroforma arctica JP610]|eukprot:XP_014151731.1 hypothetical protein SARC_09724 [Sphaeroforma arctica JP610]
MNGVTESHSQAKVAEIEDSDDVNSDATPTSVPMYSKVQRTCLELYHRFRAADPKCFDFADVDTICFSAAPTVALSLLQHKVITPRNETDDTIARWSQSGKTVLASDPLVVQLRAASVCAVESLATRTKIPRYEISHFLSEQHRKSKGSFRINAIPCRDTFAW